MLEDRKDRYQTCLRTERTGIRRAWGQRGQVSDVFEDRKDRYQTCLWTERTGIRRVCGQRGQVSDVFVDREDRYQTCLWTERTGIRRVCGQKGQVSDVFVDREDRCQTLSRKDRTDEETVRVKRVLEKWTFVFQNSVLRLQSLPDSGRHHSGGCGRCAETAAVSEARRSRPQPGEQVPTLLSVTGAGSPRQRPSDQRRPWPHNGGLLRYFEERLRGQPLPEGHHQGDGSSGAGDKRTGVLHAHHLNLGRKGSSIILYTGKEWEYSMTGKKTGVLYTVGKNGNITETWGGRRVLHKQGRNVI